MVCDAGCEKYPAGKRIVIVNLGAMGAVLMSTTILPAIKRKFPVSMIYWVTEERHTPLLYNNPYIDRVVPFHFRNVITMQAMHFDYILNVDKIPEACAFVNSLTAGKKMGFGLHRNGSIHPLNKGSEYNFMLGLDDELKFRRNQRTQADMLREMFELDGEPDEYVLPLSDDEKMIRREMFGSYRLHSPVIGINTGSSTAFPNKRFTGGHMDELIDLLYKRGDGQPVVLLGGLEDALRNTRYAEKYGEKVIATPTDEGLRAGLAYVNACDIVVTGDSLGMHMAIGLKKYIAAWFNVTCAQEIELFGRGVKIVSEAECSPCWKKECDMGLECLAEPVARRTDEAVAALVKLYTKANP